jgi:PAS domain S-box-containing protein
MKGRYPPAVLILVFVVLAAGIVAAGVLLYRSQRNSCRTKAEHELAAVADLKVRNIVDWRKERIGDAETIMLDEFLGEHVREFLGDAAHAAAPQRLSARLHAIKEQNQGMRAVLLDSQMNVRLASPTDKVYFGPVAQALAEKALRSNHVVMSDLHLSRFSGEIHLDMAIPIRNRLASPGADAPPLGVLVIEVDPRMSIFPEMQDWPTPSEMAETLLVCREGNEAVFLNELKFQKNTALALRVPLSNKDCPAVKAILGQKGIVEGIDYRGVPVLAAVRTVPDSPWFLVAKMDAAEVYAPMRERLWMIVLFVGALLFGMATPTGFLWRRQHFDLRQQKNDVESKYRNLFESSHDAMMIIAPPSWRFTDGNPATLKMFRLKSMREFTAVEPWKLSPELQPDGRSSAEKAKEMIETAVREGSHFFEWTHKRIDGHEFPATVLLTRIEQAGNVLVQATVRDVSEQKHAEQQILASLEEKEVLLKEIHHRVRNNLQVVDSVLGLYADQIEEEAAQTVFQDCRSRISSIAILHSCLCQSHTLAAVNFAEYIQCFTQQLFQAHAVNPKAITLHIDADEGLLLPIDKAAPCGMILTELLTNSLKYAFPNNREGEIRIEAHIDDRNTMTLVTADNGVGFPKEYDVQNSKSMGLQLVRRLTGQLKGTLKTDHQQGTRFTVSFPISILSKESKS